MDESGPRIGSSLSEKLYFQLFSAIHLSWKKEYRNSKIRDEVHADTIFLLILLLKMELELILFLRMDCYERSYPE